MAQDPPSGVVCSAGVVDICCLFSLSNTITSYGDRYPEFCHPDLCIYIEAVICTLKVALKSRTVDPNRSGSSDLDVGFTEKPLKLIVAVGVKQTPPVLQGEAAAAPCRRPRDGPLLVP